MVFQVVGQVFVTACYAPGFAPGAVETGKAERLLLLRGLRSRGEKDENAPCPGQPETGRGRGGARLSDVVREAGRLNPGRNGQEWSMERPLGGASGTKLGDSGAG